MLIVWRNCYTWMQLPAYFGCTSPVCCTCKFNQQESLAQGSCKNHAPRPQDGRRKRPRYATRCQLQTRSYSRICSSATLQGRAPPTDTDTANKARRCDPRTAAAAALLGNRCWVSTFICEALKVEAAGTLGASDSPPLQQQVRADAGSLASSFTRGTAQLRPIYAGSPLAMSMHPYPPLPQQNTQRQPSRNSQPSTKHPSP